MRSVVESVRWNGKQITAPGLYSDIPMRDYHRGDLCDGPSLSSTGLRTLWSQSPKHFWDKSHLNPKAAVDEDNPDFVFGRAAHHLVCGEPGFATAFIIRPEEIADEGKKELKAWHGNRRVCRDWVKAAKASGKGVLTPDDVADLRGLASEVAKHPLYRKGLFRGLIEHSMIWRDEKTGFWLKARPDAIPTTSGDYSDLKTTRLDTQYIKLQNELDSKGYIMQAALVADGARALGLEFNSFTFFWVEKVRPYSTRATTLIDADLELGSKMNRKAIEIFAECWQANRWPGPGEGRDDAEYIQLSERARERIDFRLRMDLREAA
jgi:hypothetical protein